MKDTICLFSLSNFTFGFHGFHLKKLKIIQYDCLTIECLCLGTISLIAVPRKFIYILFIFISHTTKFKNDYKRGQ